MNRKKEIKAIRDLIAHSNSQMREDNGYIGNPDKLIRLTEKQAEIALHLGIPIGVCSQYDDYHGSHAGQYSYDMVKTPNSLKYCLSQRHMESRASIYPYVPDPKRMYEYIQKVEGWSLSQQELRQSSNIGMEQLRRLTRTIASRTNGMQQFECSVVGGVYVKTDSDATVGLQMQKAADHENGCYRLEFQGYIRRMGTYMSAEEMQKTADEVSQIAKLLAELEQTPISVTQEEMAQWSEEIKAMQVEHELAESDSQEPKFDQTMGGW